MAADDVADFKDVLTVTQAQLAELEMSVTTAGIALMIELLKLLPPGTNADQTPVGKCLLAYKSAIEARAGLLAAQMMFNDALTAAMKSVSTRSH